MIKRIYPRMSTADFVARSIAIHGDLYDYSESVFQGLKDTFSFFCNRCKTTRTLAQAGTHIRKNKPCGCKPCNHEKLLPCKICGVDVSSKVYYNQQKRCKQCCENLKNARKFRVEAKHGKHCKTCGTWFVKRHNSYCSVECKKEAPRKVVEFTCANCGKHGMRVPSGIKNPSRVFCDPKCQKQFQATRFWDYQTRGQRDLGVPSIAKSKKAKAKWKICSRKQRLQTSEGAKWWSKCKEAKANITRQVDLCDWDRRCASATSMLKQRREPVFRLEKQKVYSWDKTISGNRKRLRKDLRSKEEIAWSNKINHTVRACKRRLQARSKDDIGTVGITTKAIRQELLLFAE